MSSSQSRTILPEVPKCPNCLVAYSEERVPQRFACRQHDCCKNCAEQFLKVGITQCPECRTDIGKPTTDRWLLRLAVFVRKAREAQRKRLDDGKPLTIEAKNAIESAYGYLELLFGPNGSAANGKVPLSKEIPSVPQVEEIECVMCLDVFSEQRKPVRLTCNHCVCAECAGEWTTNCPKCRAVCNKDDVEVDESLLSMAIFYTDLADTVEDAKLTGGDTPANRDILDVLAELHAYTKRVLCGPSQAAAPSASSVAAGAAGSRQANGVDDEAAAEAEFQRQLALAIAASQAAAEQPVSSRAEEQREEWEFQRRLHEAMAASVDDMHRHHSMARQQARQYAAHQPPPARPPPHAPPAGHSPQAAGGAAAPGVPVHGYGGHSHVHGPHGGALSGPWCTACGTQADAGDRFCNQCGEILELVQQLGPEGSLQAPAVSTEEWLAAVFEQQSRAEQEQREREQGVMAAAAEVRRKKKGSTMRKYLSFGLIKG